MRQTKTRNNFNYVQQHKINQLSSFTTNYMQECMIKKVYTIESVLTSHSESCTAYLLIDKGTGHVKPEH